jgi:hypothetical protein
LHSGKAFPFDGSSINVDKTLFFVVSIKTISTHTFCFSATVLWLKTQATQSFAGKKAGATAQYPKPLSLPTVKKIKTSI